MENISSNYTKLIPITLFMLLAIMTVFIMVVGQDVIIPIILAIFIVVLIDAMTDALHTRHILGRQMPRWLSMLVVFLILTAFLVWLGTVFYAEFFSFVAQMPDHQQNLYTLLAPIPDSVWEIVPAADEAAFAGDSAASGPDRLFSSLFTYMANYASTIAAGLASLISQSLLTLIYVIFLLLEHNTFGPKLSAMFPAQMQRAELEAVMASIRANIQRYISVKTVVSLMTGVVSYIVMWLFGLEHAVVWAILIFLLNFIPNIGSIIAVAFPLLTAMLQYDNWLMILALLAALMVIQMIVGSAVEPKLMGNQLNISPFVVLVSLTVFGAIWGITGAFLSVPLTVILMIVFGHFPATRPIAVLLSGDGDVCGQEYMEMTSNGKL